MIRAKALVQPDSHKDEVIRLRTKLESHLDDYWERAAAEERRYVRTTVQLESMTVKIIELMKALELQAHATDGLVKAWNAVGTIQKFALWLTGFSGFGFMLLWLHEFLSK